MYCLSSMCYVCLDKKDKSLMDINSSLAVNEDILHIIGYLPCDLGWMKTKQIILICVECCRRLRDTYEFLMMCNKNSGVLQSYIDKINNASISNADNEAELSVDINDKQDDIIKIKCEIKSDDEEIYTFERNPIIEESEEVFVNVDNYFIKEEDTWKMEVVDDEEEAPMENNVTESSDNDSGDWVIAENSNTHDTGTNPDSFEATSTQGHTTNKKELNTPATKSHKCLTCSKSFSKRSKLRRHTRVHTAEKPHKCAICEKCFAKESHLVRHIRTHTGEKPFKCAICNKCFTQQSHLVRHMRTHTGEKPHKCTICEKCFGRESSLVRHMRTHTGEKPYKCATCEKCFGHQSHLVRHMQIHTGEKP